MNEFEALKRLRQETCPATYMPDFNKDECCDVIEKALLELKAIKEAKPSEALEQIKTLRTVNKREFDNDENVNKSLDILEQALTTKSKKEQAFDVIKKTKNIKVSFYENGSGKHYKLEFDRTRNQTITQQEFDLLKEVLE